MYAFYFKIRKKNFKILFIHERHREAETQAEGKQVMGMKEGTCHEHRVMDGSVESLY